MRLNKILENNRKPIGAWGRFWAKGMNLGHSFMAKWGMKQLQWKKNWTVLDVGCGGGANLKRLLKRCPQREVYGIDISPVSVSISIKNNLTHIGSRCFVQEGSVEALPYEDERMNVVTAFETIYFWPQINRSFGEVYRVLKPGGRFMVIQDCTDPDGKPWTKYISKMKIYTLEEITGLMTEAGFTAVDVRKGRGERACIIGTK